MAITAVDCFGVYLCFGQCPGPTDEDIRRHTTIVAALAAAVLLAPALAVARRARWRVHVWHGAVGAAALATAMVFAVPRAEVRQPEPVSPGPGYVPCYSGSNDCPGG